MIPRPVGHRRWATRWRRTGAPGAGADNDAASHADAHAADEAKRADGRAGEREMLVAAAAGDLEALRWLLDEVAPTVYGFVYARVGGDDAAAEDVLQETLMEAVRGAASFRGEASASTWMCAIARRRLGRYYESERRAEVARRSLRVVEDARSSDEVAGTAELVERQDEVVRALGRLPALQRQVLVMKYLEDMPVQDIAVQVNRSRVQVQSLLQRGREGLRRELGGQGA
ncbi:MAG: sigma-70 family RNA polymerase sigma factor [Acidimicrobiales bacterium]